MNGISIRTLADGSFAYEAESEGLKVNEVIAADNIAKVVEIEVQIAAIGHRLYQFPPFCVGK